MRATSKILSNRYSSRGCCTCGQFDLVTMINYSLLNCVHNCSRANVPCVLTCSYADVPCVLKCSHANVPCALTCLRANVPCVLTCQRALCAYVLTCQRALRALRAHVPTCLACFACSRANVPCVLCAPTCSRDMTANNKNKFSITSFPYIFVIGLCLFSCEIKMLYIFAEAFNGCYDKFGTIKWFDFCLSMTLRVNFKWLIKRGDGL